MGIDEEWNVIQQCIIKFINIRHGLIEQSIDGNQYINIYDTIYDLCIEENSNCAELYGRYTESFNEYINSMVLPDLRQKHGEFMLKQLVGRWENHKMIARCLSPFFKYVDRFYTSKRSLPTVEDVGLEKFVDLVYGELKIDARNAVIALIEKERDGEQIDRSLLKNVLGMFVEFGMGKMDCYVDDLQAAMLENSGAYYSRKAASWIVEISCPEYLLKVEECLQLEKDRVSHYLHASSEQYLLDKVRNELLAHYQSQVLGSLCALLRDDKQDDLSRMFKLFDKVEKGLDPIANTFEQHVLAEGTALVKQAEDAVTNIEGSKDTSGTPGQEFVRKVLKMHDKYQHYVLECFQNHLLFQKALNEAFVILCNKRVAGSTTAELLSAFSANVLKKGSEKLSDDDIDLTLEKVVKILSYVLDKDLFAELYRKKLGRRLLFDKNANDCNERSMLTKLKQQNGSQFTSKMEGMVTDLSLSRDNQNKFVAYLNSKDIHVGLDLSVNVLTNGYWPTYENPNINLPFEMVKCIDIFKEFYSKETKDRKLTWMYSLGACNVEGRFNDNTIELIISTYQAALLMLFNESEKLSFDDVKSQLSLEDEDANRVLHSLACGKHRVLLQEPNTQKISPTDYFEVNSRFADKIKSRRIKIPLPQSDDKKKIIEDVGKLRHYVIDAAIVRIMKSRKVLSYQQLQIECVNQLKHSFKPDFKAIKKRIEDLMEREYLERDTHDSNVVKYLA